MRYKRKWRKYDYIFIVKPTPDGGGYLDPPKGIPNPDYTGDHPGGEILPGGGFDTFDDRLTRIATNTWGWKAP